MLTVAPPGTSICANICKCGLSISEFTINQLGRYKRANLLRRLADLHIDVCIATDGAGHDAAMRNSSMPGARFSFRPTSGKYNIFALHIGKPVQYSPFPRKSSSSLHDAGGSRVLSQESHSGDGFYTGRSFVCHSRYARHVNTKIVLSEIRFPVRGSHLPRPSQSRQSSDSKGN